MKNNEALKILVNRRSKDGKIDDYVVEISPLDIVFNLEQNDYNLDINMIQDLLFIGEGGDYNTLAGHSLSEVELD